MTQAINTAGLDSGLALKSAAISSIASSADRPTEGRTAEGRTVADLQTEIQFAIGKCSLGAILVAKSHKGVCAILFGESSETLQRDLQDRFPEARLVAADAAFVALATKVTDFVEAPARGLDAPLDMRGTMFQQKVWQALRGIPAGTTASYTDIAARIGAPESVRAVAQACAANALAVAIPCHRVVRRDGGLSGYRWGGARKRDLLARERIA